MNREIYKRLALAGNKNAKLILDAEEETTAEGAVPAVEADEGNSEAQELAGLTELKSQVAALHAKAQVHAEAGNHEEAGDAHMERAALHEGAGQHQDAMCAYKDAAFAFAKKLKGDPEAKKEGGEEAAEESAA